jgi:hypothetical protein
MNTSIGISGEACTIFSRATYKFDFAVLEHAVESKDIISRQAKSMLDAVVGKSANQILAYGQAFRSRNTIHDRSPAGAELAECWR